MKRTLLGLVSVIVLSGAGYLAYERWLAPVPEPAQAPVVNEIAVDTGVDVVSAEARLVPAEAVSLALSAGGRVTAVFVAAGDSVDAGDLLVQLDDAAAQAAVDQAEAALAQADAGIDAARAQLTVAQRAVGTARTGVAAAEAALALAEAPPRPEEIAALQGSVSAANSAISQAAARRDGLSSGATDAQRQAAEAQLAAAIAEEAVIQDQYDEINRNGIGGPVEEQTRLALAAAQANVSAARAALADVNAGATDADRRGASAAVGVSVAQRDAAAAQLALLEAGPRAEQVQIAAVEVDRATAVVAQAEAAVLQAEAAVAQAEAARSQAAAGLNAARAALERLVLRAPAAGIVAAVDLTVGDVVAPAVPVITIADLERWQVETTDLTELDVVAVAVGMPVSVRLDALPDNEVAGRVSDIARTAGLSRGDVTYAVTIDLLDTAGLPLRWGMTAFVDIDVR